MTLLAALGRAMRDLAQPRIVAVLLLPMLASIAAWSLLLYIFWDAWRAALRSFIESTAPGAWLASHAEWLASGSSAVLLVALVLPAIVVTALLFTELVAMPAIVSVASRRHPTLARHGDGGTIGSLVNAGSAAVVFAVVWVITLPLWLTGIGAVVLPAINSAYLNQRLFRYDALAEHATRAEYGALVRRARGRLYALGLILAPLYYVPVVNLAAPVVSGLAFTHFCLGELARMRGAQ
jgi:hypothetical protein